MLKKIYLILTLLISITSIYLGFNSTIIPNMILYIIIAFFLLNFIIITLMFMSKKKALNIIGIFLSMLLLICDIGLCIVYIKTNNFFNKITNVEYEKSNYSLIVLKDSKFTQIKDLNEVGTYYSELDKNYNKAKEELNSDKILNNKPYENIFNLVNDLLDNKIESIFINENYIEIINENNDKFKDSIRVLETYTIESIKEKEENTIDISKLENFNIYISGIDTYGEINTVSRSDVNILASIDLKNNKILLTNTPRDYYVQVAGTTGTKDKLTHAGVYGIDTSIKTIENLYDTKISYYVRVNFNSLILLVDEIGGVDIYSDTSFGSGKFYVKNGWNHFDGTQALGYSRQRYAYIDGDRHRGKNQQQVIEAIIKKVTDSNDINTYMKLLNTLQNSFQTNMDKKMINGFINLQVENNYKWSVESISVTGYDSSNYTYSYPGQLLYVMEPDYSSLETAKNRIKEIINNN